MSSKRTKGRQPGVDQKDEQEHQSRELARYVPPVPENVKATLREFFRSLGVDMQCDQDERTYAVFAKFPDRSEIYVTGGNFGPEIGCTFSSDIPLYTAGDTLMKAIDKAVYKVTMLAKLGYLQAHTPSGARPFPDIISRGKATDTTNAKTVLQEVKRIAKILGHYKEKRGGAKRRR